MTHTQFSLSLQFAYTPQCYEEWSDELQLVAKSRLHVNDSLINTGESHHKAKAITKWLRQRDIEILGPWPGNSSDLHPIDNKNPGILTNSKGSALQILTLCITSMYLSIKAFDIWNACGYTSVYHRNIWQKDLWKPICVSFSKLLAMAVEYIGRKRQYWLTDFQHS